jgi:hypothetical protein
LKKRANVPWTSLIVDLATVHREWPTASLRTGGVFRKGKFRAQDASLNVRIRTAKVFSRRISGEDFAKRKADEFKE